MRHPPHPTRELRGNRRTPESVRVDMRVVVLLLLLVACQPQQGGASHVVHGRAVAGPTCPGPVTAASDGCRPRPVDGARLLITDQRGTQVASVTTGSDGSWQVSLPNGSYTVEPQPVEGLMGGGAPVDFTVAAGKPGEPVVVEYDTGIR